MSAKRPTNEQKFGEALTAAGVAKRIFVRTLLETIGQMVDKPAPELSRNMQTSIDAYFLAYRNLLHESLNISTAITIEEQRTVLEVRDTQDTQSRELLAQRAELAAYGERIAELERVVKDLQLVNDLNRIGDTE